jgi:MFS family permease
MLNQNFRTPEFTRATRDTIAVILLITNAFIWYYFASHFLKETVGALNIDYWTTALIWSAHYGGIIASAVIGYLLTRKFKDRTKFLTFWLALGVIASLTSMAVNITSASCVLFISLFLGISLGLGMPCCMGYFTEKIKIDRRGSIGGTVLLVSGVGMLLLGMVSDANPFRQTLILTVWRLFGLLCFMLLKTPNQLNQPVEAKKVLPYRSIINRQSFILYFVPWLMFSLLSFLSVPIQNKIVGQSTVDLLLLIESALGGVFAIVGGFFADVLGRKRIAIGGFALLGIGYSILGLFYDNLLSWYLYTVVDGIALGLLYVVFVVTIWGDFGPSSTSDKYYAIGVLPFFLSKYM